MRPLILSFFFLSGLSGLLYEVAWIRTAGTVIGNTVYAVGTVVGVYMAGLALGAWWGGRAADRRSGGRLLRLYGILEGGVALSALAVPWLLAAGEPIFRALWTALGETALFALLRAGLVALVLALPTTLMGATLPVLARFLSETPELAAREAGRAYAVNTLGGVLGTLAAGFWFIPSLGLQATTFVAAALNLAIGAAAMALARGAAGEVRPAAPGPALRRLPLAVAALSGFSALVYEMAWTRALVLSMGSTVYAFTIILAAFILGLALGSAAASWLLPRLKVPARALAAVQAAAGLLALLLLPFLGDLPLRFASLLQSLQSSHAKLLLAESALAALFVMVPTLFLGAVFPLACRLAEGPAVGRSIAAVYAWNTVGSIAGSLLASFLLVPWIGLSASIKVAATINLACASAILLADPGRRRLAPVPAGIALAAWVLLPGWSPAVLSSGAFFYGAAAARRAEDRHVDLRRYLEEETRLIGEYWDSYGLVTVHRHGDGVLTMRVNGKADASTGPSDRLNMVFVGHVPLLLHPAPKKALLVGLGGGLTLQAMARHPLERLDCVEISPAVARAAVHFRESNGDVLADPRVRLTVADGRNTLLYGADSYDVIVSQPSNLWISGMANLFTLEFFQVARRRLSPDGVFGQWVHAYRLGADDFRSVLRTFYRVFPGGSVWEIFPGHDYLLVGQTLDAPIPGDFVPRLRSTRALAEYLSSDPGDSLRAYRVLTAAEARTSAGNGPLITDDLCAIEYTAPRALHSDQRPEILSWLEPLRPANARRLLAQAVRLQADGKQLGALDALERALKEVSLDPRTRVFLDLVMEAVLEMGRRRLDAGDFERAEALLRRIPPASSRYADARVELGDLGIRKRDPAAAETHFQAAREADPASFGAAVGLAHLREARGQFGEAIPFWREAVGLREDPTSHFHLAVCLWRTGNVAEARKACERAVQLGSAEAATLLRQIP